jgi:hypothetical protein
MRMLADSHNILNRWKNYFCQLLNIHGVNDVRQTEIHTADPLVPTSFFFSVVMITLKMKSYKSPGLIIFRGLRSAILSIFFGIRSNCPSSERNLLSIYIKRLGMFPFKLKLFQGCKSETEPIHTKSVVQHVIWYQVLLAAYYKADTKYCWRHITKLIPSIVGGILQSRYQVLLAAYYKADTKYCWRHITKLIPSIVGGILQSRYQVLLAAYYKADTKYCWRHITKLIPSIVVVQPVNCAYNVICNL